MKLQILILAILAAFVAAVPPARMNGRSCRAGKHWKKKKCIKCKKGFFSSNGRKCRKCPKHFIARRRGATRCTECPPGTRSNKKRTKCKRKKNRRPTPQPTPQPTPPATSQPTPSNRVDPTSSPTMAPSVAPTDPPVTPQPTSCPDPRNLDCPVGFFRIEEPIVVRSGGKMAGGKMAGGKRGGAVVIDSLDGRSGFRCIRSDPCPAGTVRVFGSANVGGGKMSRGVVIDGFGTGASRCVAIEAECPRDFTPIGIIRSVGSGGKMAGGKMGGGTLIVDGRFGIIGSSGVFVGLDCVADGLPSDRNDPCRDREVDPRTLTPICPTGFVRAGFTTRFVGGKMAGGKMGGAVIVGGGAVVDGRFGGFNCIPASDARSDFIIGSRFVGGKRGSGGGKRRRF